MNKFLRCFVLFFVINNMLLFAEGGNSNIGHCTPSWTKCASDPSFTSVTVSVKAPAAGQTNICMDGEMTFKVDVDPADGTKSDVNGCKTGTRKVKAGTVTYSWTGGTAVGDTTGEEYTAKFSNAGTETVTCTVTMAATSPCSQVVDSDSINIDVRELDLDIGSVSDADEETEGGYLCLNDDDDDDNSTADKDDTGTLSGEDDLVSLSLSHSGFSSGTLKLKVTKGSSKIKLWESSTKGTQVTLSKEDGVELKSWTIGTDTIPSTLYIEGIINSSGLRDISLELEVDDGTMVCSDTVNATVYKIDKVEWVVKDSDLDDNENSGGGQRIFPGNQTENDTTARDIVEVKVTMDPAAEGVTVYYKNFDVDDPYTDDDPIDDNGSDGGDNRGGSGTLSASSATTDENGEATVELTVTKSPGDNFRVGVSCDADELNDVGDNDVPASNSPTVTGQPGHFTELLTVWRKLHYELDAMERPTFTQNTDSGDWDDPYEKKGRTFIDVSTTRNVDDGEYTGGFIKIKFSDGTSVVKFITKFHDNWPSDNQVEILGTGFLKGETSGTHEIGDDDFDSPVFTGGVHGSIDHGLPSDIHMRPAFKKAYIYPQEDGDASDDDIPFERNIPHAQSNPQSLYWSNSKLVQKQDLTSSSDFWAVTIVALFQPGEGNDGDPNSEASALINGVTPISAYNGTNNVTCVFKESLKESSASEKRAVVHEVGHTLGLEHPAAGDEGGIMEIEAKDDDFIDDDIDFLRNLTNP